MKVTLAFLLCLVTLTIVKGAPSPTVPQVNGAANAAVIENQPVVAIESADFAQQPFEANDAMDTSATHYKRYYYPNAYHYPHYYPRYYSNYHYPRYYNHYY
jgi:hypothetical protein